MLPRLLPWTCGCQDMYCQQNKLFSITVKTRSQTLSGRMHSSDQHRMSTSFFILYNTPAQCMFALRSFNCLEITTFGPKSWECSIWRRDQIVFSQVLSFHKHFYLNTRSFRVFLSQADFERFLAGFWPLLPVQLPQQNLGAFEGHFIQVFFQRFQLTHQSLVHLGVLHFK